MIEPGLLTAILNVPSVEDEESNQTFIHVTSCTVEDLFNAYLKPLPRTSIKGKVCIPEYQRSYVWKERQVNKLLNDLIEHGKNPDDKKPLYYLGSIILHLDSDRLNIIDGQQRLTTMLILNSFLPNKIASTIKYHSPETIDNIKFVHSYLKAIAERQIPEFPDLNFSDFEDFSKINITLIITKSEDLAYTFFETQNTGGVRLGGADIAKAHHLRAIDCKKTIAFQARRWESRATEEVENCIKNLIKIRYWNFSHWQYFPFYRDQQGIKETIIDEFTERTIHQPEDVSFYYGAVKKQGHHSFQTNESPYRHIRQPLYDGNNFLDYISEYVELQEILFKSVSDHRIPDSFMRLREKLLHGKDGTVFLKELFEIILTTYVSRFGFERLFEVSLWLYRYVYSLRVSMMRNVREDTIFKFAKDNAIVDKILQSYTINEVLIQLKGLRYSFSPDNIEDHQSKGKHVQCLKHYFFEYGLDSFTTAKKMCNEGVFDKALINNINTLIKQINANG